MAVCSKQRFVFFAFGGNKMLMVKGAGDKHGRFFSFLVVFAF